jgi:DNA (cytosine-5)-methyltransferase 1
MDLGFQGGFAALGKTYEKLPFRMEWANDFNEAACRSYRRNVSEHIVHGDVWEHMPSLPKQADVVIGGFPCQDISINGKRAGANGKRSGLYRAMIQVIARCKPKVFVVENVKGLLQRYNKESLAQVVTDFSELGYNLSYNLYQAADYGIPQTRERVFIVGTSSGTKPFRPPWPTHQPGEWLTSKEAISDLEVVAESEAINHVWSRAERSPEQGDRRLKPDRPAYTIRAECHGNIQYHYALPRRISMREAARFQSFPDDFIFVAKLRETERQVGNAAPPVLAWHMARAVLECIE